MQKTHLRLALSLALALSVSGPALAAPKDIVLDRVQTAAAAPVTSRAAVRSDAMAVSILVESPDGTLTSRSVNTNFRTGERFRVKVVAARDGHIALFNTKPSGETPAAPVWRGPIKAGEELVTPRLRLDGQQGEDLLHIVLEQSTPEGTWAWVRRMLGLDEKGMAMPGATKDIVLDVQNTASTTYVVNPRGEGLTTTLTIRHRR
ncbi:MAG: hypothetical protein ACK5O3_14890 [Burkholderiales bacterium]|jgi:hypothetical protein